MKKLLLLGVIVSSSAFAVEPIPYSVDFKQEESLAGWTPFDANHDGKTWDYLSYMGDGLCIDYPTANHDDWLYSPDLSLEKSVSYKISVEKDMFGASYMDPLGKIEVYAGAGNNSADYRAVGTLDLTVGTLSDEVLFTSEEGECRIAFRNTLSRMDPVWFIQRIRIEKNEAVQPGQTIKLDKDFSSDKTADGWTIIDGNADKSEWDFIDGADGIALPMSQNGNADDWLISPVVSGIEKGKGYILSFTIGAAGGFEDELVDVYYGETNTQEAMAIKVSSEVIPSGSKITRYCRIFPDMEGNLAVGLHGVSPVANGTVTLSNILLRESEGVRPVAPADFVVKSNIKAGQTTLSWTNPAIDAENIAIGSEIVHIDIYRDNVKIQTVEGAAGASMTYVDSPAPFEGETIYKVVAWCESGLESEPVEQTITLDDFQGDPKTFAAWGGDNDSFQNWKVVDVDGYQSYGYTSWNNGMELLAKSSRDDWMFSPAVSLAPNRRYIIKADIKVSGNYPSDFELTIGTAQTPVTVEKVLKTFSADGNGVITYETDQFGVDYKGEYYIGLRCTKTENWAEIHKIELQYLENSADPESVPFIENFNESSALTDWVLPEQTSFSLQNMEGMDGNSLVSVSADGAERNEIAFSPMISLRSDYTYEVAFDYAFGAESNENNRFEFFMAKGQSEEELILSEQLELAGTGRATVKFTPEADGTYCLAFRIVAESRNGESAAIDNIEVGKKVYASLPYAEDFESYTTINSVPVGWENAVIATDASAGNVAKLSGTAKTPVFTHSEMRETYNLTFKVKKGEVPVTVKVTDGEKTEPIAELTGEMSGWTEQTIAIKPLSTENPFDFWILFECGEGYAEIDNVEISMAEREITAGAPTDLYLSYSYAQGQWNFSWKNPVSDADGYELNRDVTVNVYYKDTVLATATGAPGYSMNANCQFEENYENGAMIFRAVAFVADTKGLAATTVLRPREDDRYTVEKAVFDFSDDEAWDNTGWTKEEECLTTENESVLTSPVFELEEGKLYAVDYGFVATANETATFTVSVLNEQGGTVSEQVFSQVYLGFERDGSFPKFTMELPRIEAAGKYRLELTASEVNSSVSVQAMISVLELREYPEECGIPYFNDFEDEAIADGWRQPNWTLHYSDNVNSWGFATLNGSPVDAHSGERVMAVEATDQATREDWLYTPYFTFEEGKHYLVEFEYFIEGVNSTLEFVYAFAPTNIADEYVSFVKLSNEGNAAGWKSYSVPLDPEGGKEAVTFGFVGRSAAANDGIIAIEDFRISERDPQGVVDSLDADADLYFAENRLYVPDGCLRIMVFNAQGRMVYSAETDGTCVVLPELSKGVYIVKAHIENDSVQTVKFIK